MGPFSLKIWRPERRNDFKLSRSLPWEKPYLDTLPEEKKKETGGKMSFFMSGDREEGRKGGGDLSFSFNGQADFPSREGGGGEGANYLVSYDQRRRRLILQREPGRLKKVRK